MKYYKSDFQKIKEQISKITALISLIETRENDEKSDCFPLYGKLNFESEKLALMIRKFSILNATQAEKNSLIFEDIKKGTCVKCTQVSDSLVRIDLPPLLNYRYTERKSNKEIQKIPKFFTDVSKFNIKEYILQNQIKLNNKKQVLLIFNVVDKNKHKNWIPDTDNREYHEVINAIKEFFLIDDSSDFVSYYLDTIKMDEEDKTIIFLTSMNELLNNIDKIKGNLGTDILN